MCYQHITYYACGHSKLVETDCERALDHPFAARAFCKDYESGHSSLSVRCGLGSFYCKETPDGEYLERVHAILDDAHSKLQKADVAINSLLRVREVLKNNATPMSHAGLTPKVYNERIANISQIRLKNLEDHNRAAQTTQIAFEFYKRRTQRLLLTAQPLLPESDDFLRYLHDTQAKSMISAHSIDVSAKNASDTNIAIKHLLPPFGHGGDNIFVGHLKRSLAAESAARAVQFDSSRHPRTTINPTVASTSGRQSKLKKESSFKRQSLTPDSTELRRSTRTRNKKVNYAESEGSSVKSREPSPNKSEISSFSPYKSGRSTSPEKRNRSIGSQRKHQSSAMDNIAGQAAAGGSLKALISEWRSSRISPVATTNLGTVIQPHQSEFQEHKTVFQTPEQRTFKSTALGASAGPGPSTNVSPYQTPGSTFSQNRLPPDFIKRMIAISAARNQNLAQPMLQPSPEVSPPYQISNPGLKDENFGLSTRSDSTMGHPPSQHNSPDQKPSATPEAGYYAQMRRSFNSTMALTPSPAALINGSGATDPKKRALPTSSPRLEPAKRMRLSLPSEEAMPSIYSRSLPYDQGGSFTSPPKMPSLHAGKTAREIDPAVPPTFPAPMARMFAPSQDQTGACASTGRGAGQRYDHQQVGEEGVAMTDDYDVDDLGLAESGENYTSDIDWGDVLQDEMWAP